MSESTYVEKMKRRLSLFECADGSYDRMDMIEYCQKTFGVSPRSAKSIVSEVLGESEDD